MDEILIEEKRYISSKRAAKVTGYAKDYIGQLCREGRVPARLVGRNWYVLETAIHDHRFGQQDHALTGDVETESTAQALQSTWESPRYEASPAEVLPSFNRAVQDAETPPADEQHEAPQALQDSWREWFDRVADAASAIPDVISSGKPTEEEKEEREEVVADEKDEKEVRIPIRAIHHQRYQAPPEELLPQALTQQEVARRRTTEDERNGAPEEAREQRKIGRSAIMTIQTIGVLLAVLSASLAIIGSGYFDTYISSTRAGIFAGIVIHNK